MHTPVGVAAHLIGDFGITRNTLLAVIQASPKVSDRCAAGARPPIISGDAWLAQ
jgi:hypothetical protein